MSGYTDDFYEIARRVDSCYQNVRENWRDANAERFETQFWQTFERDMNNMREALEEFYTALEHAKFVMEH